MRPVPSIPTLPPARRGLRSSPTRQRGVGALALVVLVVLVAIVAWAGLRITPTVMEYMSIRSAVNKIARENPGTVASVRDAFNKQMTADYLVTSIKAQDLDVSKEGGILVIRFSYQKEIPIVGPLSLLINYAGEARGTASGA